MKKIALIISIGLLITGCASIVSGTRQQISIHSNVNGALVTLNGASLGLTPLTAEIKKAKNQTLVIKKDGYITQELKLITKLNLAFWGNILIGGTIGSSTDSSTGAWYEYSPNSYFINLEVEKKSAKETEKFKKESELRYFVMMNFDRVNKDVSLGKGDYLDSVYEIFSAKNDSDKLMVLSYMKEAQSKSKNIPEFAELIVKHL